MIIGPQARDRYSFELLSRQSFTSGSPASTITFSNLDGNRDFVYYFEWDLISSSTASDIALNLKPNNVTSNQVNTYGYTGYHAADTHGAGRNRAVTNMVLTVFVPQSTQVVHNIGSGEFIVKTRTSGGRLYNGRAMNYDNSNGYHNWIWGGVWNENSTNITSIVLSTSSGTVWGDISLYRRIL
jgi:hypothetical protein